MKYELMMFCSTPFTEMIKMQFNTFKAASVYYRYKIEIFTITLKHILVSTEEFLFYKYNNYLNSHLKWKMRHNRIHRIV